VRPAGRSSAIRLIVFRLSFESLNRRIVAMNDRRKLAVVVAVPTEPEASLIVGELAERGIQAVADGIYTAAHWAISPGVVRVLVNRDDLDRARAAMIELCHQPAAVDWSQVDVGEPEPE
jgi:hypothetical protein